MISFFRVPAIWGLLLVSLSAMATFELKPAYINKEKSAGEISIDGLLKERVWQDAAVIHNLVEVYPDDHGRSTDLETEIKVFYNEHGMFIGFWCETPREKQQSRLSFRDNTGMDRDWFRVSIDPTGQGVNGYYMELALGGSKLDGTILDERNRRGEWDGPWLGVTQAQENGWSGEMYLPWSMFALPDEQAEERNMGIHFERWVAHLSQRWAWEPLSDRDPRYLSGFSRLKIRNIDSPSSLIIYPYASAAHDQLGDSTTGRGGVDLFWTPTAGVRLAATALPDFGQVESDDLVVNLDAVETFFPEKRPFFMEDSSLYDTRKYNLVHTRRIGSAPDRPEIREGYQVRDMDGSADILLASKLSGQKGNYRYGGMFAIEDDARYTLVNQETGETSRESIQGRQFYTGRLIREFQSDKGAFGSIGWLGTLTERPAIDREAQVHTLDFNYRSADGKINVAWQGMASMIRDDNQDKNGFGTWVDATWRPNRKWDHWAEIVSLDRKLDVNDLGFLWRNNQNWLSYLTTYKNSDNPHFRDIRTSFNIWHGENQDGRLLEDGIWGEHYLGFNNRTSLRFAGSHLTDRWDDLISRGNGIVRLPHRTNLVVGWDSDSSKKLGVYAEYRIIDYGWGNGFNVWETRINGRYTMNEHLDFRLESQYRQHHDWLLWRGSTDFATYSAKQLVPVFRTNVLFSTRQDLRLVLQYFAINAKADQSLALNQAGDLHPLEEDPSRHDFAVGSMGFQVRYRYEIAPLSDLFAVYSRGGDFSENQTNRLGDLWSNTLDNKTADNFMLKFRYRFD